MRTAVLIQDGPGPGATRRLRTLPSTSEQNVPHSVNSAVSVRVCPHRARARAWVSLAKVENSSNTGHALVWRALVKIIITLLSDAASVPTLCHALAWCEKKKKTTTHTHKQCCEIHSNISMYISLKQESPPAWTQEAYRPLRSRSKCLLFRGGT